ncbi:GntR family transcriptional regulator, phosphonate transport system regulatory protein [Mesorhizobium albiziae]|uniref:GntR family transcriptional regulator, phosphonate transport system regulatory protein n=1 Tax=Neomesorhizobium albiziae TaxID=335020 RepID=A0A1I3WV12_9HYPH|nr:phosphonate metabolism transcriptional regulator PhnF [Mesorhizobium albiziae]GLS31892.1 phosphonate metabolism transcriptional regulator PhnF [Mesorhizobium albiziae]SFK11083.1 GntR family transcriptional regulator, phosphonate transport system regulatory protein [Mesorhizobium albiziae]
MIEAGLKPSVTRKSGVALWRQIADQMRQAIGSGALGADGRLPPEFTLSQRFGVNRHTLRSAIAALVQEGVLRAEQGRGTFVESRKRLSYPISARTRFSTGLRDQTRDRRSVLLADAVEPAGERVAEALGLAAGSNVIRLETLSEADGRPVSRATSWFDAKRFAGFARHYAKTGSITASFQKFGIDDYFRHSTLVSARHADAADLTDLKLSPGAIVLVAIAVNVDPKGKPIQFAETRFAADRVELTVSTEA